VTAGQRHPRIPVRYKTAHQDSARWNELEFRPGDIVISARPRSGTTWMQMICALLVFQDPELPAPLSELSPWLDWKTTPLAEVLSALAAQRHRRFIKTHTPLDGLPLDPRVTYVVVARHPLDAAVSLYHHYANLDVRRLNRLQGLPDPGPEAPTPARRPRRRRCASGCGRGPGRTPGRRTASIPSPGTSGTRQTRGPAGMPPTSSWRTMLTCPRTCPARCAGWPDASALPSPPDAGRLC
jgi:hypothetical protein